MFPLEERCLNNAKQITEKVKDFTMLYDKRLFLKTTGKPLLIIDLVQDRRYYEYLLDNSTGNQKQLWNYIF